MRRLSEQQGALAQVRTAAGVVLTAATIASSFLASVALSDTKGMPGIGWVGIVSLVVAVGACLWSLRGVTLRTSTDANTLAQPEWTNLDGDAARLALARHLANSANKNNDALRCTWVWVDIAIGATGVTLLAWTLAIATKGS